MREEGEGIRKRGKVNKWYITEVIAVGNEGSGLMAEFFMLFVTCI